nr:MAG: hypothetical protein [uncultured archaeon]
MTKEEKKPIVIQFQHIIIQFVIIIFYTIVWLNAPLFGTGELNVNYFLFMFIALLIGTGFTLYSKSNPEVPIPIKPTQQFTNLIKAMTDIITNKLSKTIPDIKDIIQKALVWSLREAKISPEFDKDTIVAAEDYIIKKLYPDTDKKEGEEESQSTG